MIGLLFVAGVCTVCFAIEIARLLGVELRSLRRALLLRREARKAKELREQARRIHRLHPCRETRLRVAQGEAICDLIAAAQAEDWETAAAFAAQVETVEALLEIPDPTQPIAPWHRERLEASPWN